MKKGCTCTCSYACTDLRTIAAQNEKRGKAKRKRKKGKNQCMPSSKNEKEKTDISGVLGLTNDRTPDPNTEPQLNPNGPFLQRNISMEKVIS